MHYYSKDFRYTKYIHLIIAAIAAFISFHINGVLIKFDQRIVGSISFFSVFAILEILFEKYAWKLLTFIPIFAIKDFNGAWLGSLYIGRIEEKYDARIDIRQNWSKISVSFDGKDASGRSFSASIFADRLGDGKAELSYIYYARSKNLEQRNYFDHYGSAILSFGEDNNILSGEYFTEKSRNSFGRMELRRHQ